VIRVRGARRVVRQGRRRLLHPRVRTG
jgi:hypothetical protein